MIKQIRSLLLSLFIFSFPLSISAIELEISTLSIDKKLLALAHDDNIIRIFSLETGKLLKELNYHEESIQTISFNHDGSQLISGSWDDYAILWDIKTGEILSRKKMGGTVMHAFFSPNTENIALSVDDIGLVFYDKTLTKKENSFPISDRLKPSKDGKLLAGESAEGFSVVNIDTRELLFNGPVQSRNDKFYFTDDNEFLIIVDESRSYVWNVKDQSQIEIINSFIRGDVAAVNPLKKELWLAKDDHIEILNYKTFKTIALVKLKELDINDIWDISFSKDGEQAAILILLENDTSKVIIMDTSSYEINTLITPQTIVSPGIEFLENDLLFLRSKYPTEIWNIKTQKKIFNFTKEGSNLDVNLQEIAKKEHIPFTSAGRINGLDVSPITGNIILTGEGSGDSNLELNSKGEFQQFFKNPYSTGYDARYSPDGKIAAFAYHGEHLLLYNVADNSLYKEFDLGGVPNGTRIIKFSRDSKYLAAGSDGNTVSIIDVNNKKIIDHIEFPAGVFSLQWISHNKILVGTLLELYSLDLITKERKIILAFPVIGLDAYFENNELKMLAVGRQQGTILLLDKEFKQIKSYPVIDVGRISFSEDGKNIIAASNYQTHIINLLNNTQIDCPENDQLWAMAYDKKHKLIYSGGDEGKIYVHDHQCNPKFNSGNTEVNFLKHLFNAILKE